MTELNVGDYICYTYDDEQIIGKIVEIEETPERRGLYTPYCPATFRLKIETATGTDWEGMVNKEGKQYDSYTGYWDRSVKKLTSREAFMEKIKDQAELVAYEHKKLDFLYKCLGEVG